MLPQDQFLLSSVQSLLIELGLVAEIFKLGLHIQFLSFDALFFLLLPTLGSLLFFLELLGCLPHHFHVLGLLLFKQYLLIFIAFLLNTLLRSHFSEFQFIEGHIPISSLIVFVLFLSRVVRYTQ